MRVNHHLAPDRRVMFYVLQDGEYAPASHSWQSSLSRGASLLLSRPSLPPGVSQQFVLARVSLKAPEEGRLPPSLPGRVSGDSQKPHQPPRLPLIHSRVWDVDKDSMAG